MTVAQKEELKQVFLSVLREDSDFRQQILEELRKEVTKPVEYIDDKKLDETVEKHFKRFDDVFKALA